MIDVAPPVLAGLFGAGLLAGFVDSIAGGGGLIALPALLAAGLPPHDALGTNKLQSSFGSLTASLNYRRGKHVRFRRLAIGIAWTALGAWIGTVTIQALPPDVLKHVIPVLLAGIFIYTWIRPDLGAVAQTHRIPPAFFYPLFGCLLGFYDGFFGPGTGSFWMVAFVLGLGFDLTKATAHTKVVNFTSNIVSLAAFAAAGHVAVAAGLTMAVGQVVGAVAGSHLVLRRGTRFVRVFFLAVVAATLARLMWTTYR